MQTRRFIRDSMLFAVSQYVFRVLLMARGLVAARLMGPGLYGEWNAIQLVMDYGALALLGTFQGLDQRLPPRLVDGDTAAIDRTQRAGLFNVLALSLLYAIGTLIYFSFSTGNVIHWWGLKGVAIAVACVVLSNLGYYHINLLRAHNRMTSVSLWYFTQGTIGAGIALGLIPRLGVWGLLWGWLAGTIAASVITQFQVRHVAPLVPRPQRESLELIRTGTPMYLYSASVILRSLDRVIILKFLDSAALGYYSLAVTAMTLLLYLPDSVSFVLYPQLLRRFRAGGDQPEAVRVQVERTYRTLSVLVPVMCGLAFLWSRDVLEFALPKFLAGLPAMRMICFGAGGLAFVGLSAIVLMTLGRQRFLVPAALLGCLLGAALDLIAVKLGFGITGVATATMTAYILNGLTMTALAFGGLEPTRRATLWASARTFAPLAWGLLLAWAIDRWMPHFGGAGAGGRAARVVVEGALFVGLYGIALLPLVRGTGLRQVWRQLRPGWAGGGEVTGA